jgi:hypothetical protein
MKRLILDSLTKGERKLSRKKKSKVTRTVAVLLVVLLVLFNMPASMMTPGFAQNNPQASSTLQNTNGSAPVSVNNADPNGKIQFTAAVNGGNGSIAPEQETVAQNGNVEVTLKPDDHYRVSAFTINGTPIDLEQLTDHGDGTFTYTVANMTKDTSVEVRYEPILVLTGPWTNYVSVQPVAGSVAKDLYQDGNNQIIVFSKDARLSVKPVSPYSELRMLLSGSPSFQDWKTEYDYITSTIAISNLQVKQQGNTSQGEVNLNGGHLLFAFDTQKPVVDDPKVKSDHQAMIDGYNWYSGNVTVSGTITNDPQTYEGVSYKTDINKVYYSKGGYSPSNAKVAYDSAAVSGGTTDPVQYSFNPADEDYNGEYSIWAVDKAGNQSDVKTVKINIDKTAPDLAGKEAVTFTQTNDNFFAKAINTLTFGTFFKTGVQVTVHAADSGSGVKEISLLPKGTDNTTVNPKEVSKSFSSDGRTATETFSLDTDHFTGTFDVILTDQVGNSRTILVNDSNSNIKAQNGGKVMIENNQPSAAISVTPNTRSDGTPVSSYEREENGKIISIYNGDVTFHFKIADPDSGVNTVKIDVNDQPYKVYDFSDGLQTDPTVDSISTDHLGDIKVNADGSYVVKVYVTDNAGNSFTTEKTIYMDKTSPVIANVHFSSDDGNSGDTGISVEPTDYGFFFKKPTKVTVTAIDPGGETASTVQSETIYLKDNDNGKYYAVGEDGKLTEIAAADIGKIAAIPTSGDVTFYVPENFKGQIFAKATDHVNNAGAYQSPPGMIVESEAQHAGSASISLDKEATVYKDNSGLDLYAKNVPVNVKVSDPYSGIGKVEWSVSAPYDTAHNQSGTAVIDNAKNVTGDSDWNLTKTDQNLVTEMTKTILVQNDSNGIVLHVKLTDRAGNTSEKDMTFSIDKTAPTISVTYDNNSPDQQYTDYYKADRTATVVISERNFRPEDVQYKITNKDGSVPKLVGWSTVENAQDPNQTKHIATIKYSSDGDYTFDIQYQDNAGNLAAPFNEQKFTIDKTIPVVNVSYNNNAASNGDYYKASRTATIKITEHNFDPARVKVTGIASDNGNAVAFPPVSGWVTNGDIHTATINYSVDAKYSFDIDFTDKAGNIAADYKPDQFIIDQTAPKITISGVADKSANKGDVIPVISYSDTNFNKNGVSLLLSGANRGNVASDGSFADAAGGEVYTFKNFAKDKKVDDIYTLTAKVVDFAGNQTTQTVQFSVNRFGSVYVLDDSMKQLENKYVQHEKDVVVTETNVDTLKPESVKVKLTKNGTPSDLTPGKDYTIIHSGGNGQWSEYKYVVKKELFAGDGKYSVSLYSEDQAGNINENIDENKKAEISFGIDKTAPVIIPIAFESGKEYPVDKKSVSVSIKDNLVLKDAQIYLNGKKVAPKVDGENYTFTIPSSNSKQNVKIEAIDAAGNRYVKNVNDFLVSTNPIVRLYNNTPLFMGSIGGVGTAGALAIYLVARKMRKIDED